MRIAVVTPLFPTRAEPYRGSPVSKTVQALARLADVRVFYPHAEFPRWRFLQPQRFLYSEPDRGALPPGLEATYLPYPALPLLTRPVNGFSCARRLASALREAKPDLVLAYWLYPEGYGAVLAAERLSVPVVLGARGSDLRTIPDAISARLTSAALRRASAILTVSADLRDQAILLGAPADRVRTISNGCDGALFRPASRVEARRAFDLRPDSEVVLFVGRLHSVKGLTEMLQAAAQLATRRPRLEFAIIGEGPLEAELRTRAESPAMAGRVRMLGSRTPAEVARWLAACNLLCLPSYSEGCPNVVIEALSCGRPVVASAVGGVPELVDSTCAVLVPPRDAGALAEALAAALDRPWDEGAIAARFGRSWDQVGKETYEVCCQVLKRTAAAAR